MFVDASALVAILTREDGYLSLAKRLQAASQKSTSAFAIFETVTAICRKTGQSLEAGEIEVQAFLAASKVSVVPITVDEASVALSAFARFGKGRGHPARLNLGDCFAYACARTHGVPLLFVGNDFVHTDIPSA